MSIPRASGATNGDDGRCPSCRRRGVVPGEGEVRLRSARRARTFRRGPRCQHELARPVAWCVGHSGGVRNRAGDPDSGLAADALGLKWDRITRLPTLRRVEGEGDPPAHVTGRRWRPTRCSASPPASTRSTSAAIIATTRSCDAPVIPTTCGVDTTSGCSESRLPPVARSLGRPAQRRPAGPGPAPRGARPRRPAPLGRR